MNESCHRHPFFFLQVFKAIARSVDSFITVRVSYLEIYNETLCDLLATTTNSGTGDVQMAVVDCPRGVYVKGLSIHSISHEEDALNLLFEASQANIPILSVVWVRGEAGQQETGGQDCRRELQPSLFSLSAVWEKW